MISAMKRRIVRFLRDTRGSILIIAGVGMFLTIGIGGAATDFAFQQLDYKNFQHAGDIAATSAAGSRLSEQWGRSNTAATLSEQERRVRMLYDANIRGFDQLDSTFELSQLEVIDIPAVPPSASNPSGTEGIYQTIIRGTGKSPTRLIRVVGVSELPYTIETVTNLRNPGQAPVYDMVLLLDYTTSMTATMTDGDTRLDALRSASKFLSRTVMCGNEEGVDCDPENKNRIGMIPYGLTAIGLDECDGPNPPAALQCHCRMPRGYTDPSGNYDTPEEAWEGLREHEGGKPESCRDVCDRVDSDGRPSNDPLSAYFNCTCMQPLNCDLVIDELTALEQVIYDKCTPKCTKGGCCPRDKCHDHGMVGNRDCIEREVRSYPSSPCCAVRSMECETVTVNEVATCEGVPPNPYGAPCHKQCDEGETTCEGEVCSIRTGPIPPQTVCCDQENCTRSCSASGGPEDPCAVNPKPAHCIPGTNPPAIPPRPAIPALGLNGTTEPGTSFASAIGAGGQDMFSATYTPGSDRFATTGDDARLILAQSSGGVWARSLMDCLDDGQIGCMENMEEAFANTYLEANTNSASAFDAFSLYDGYLSFMRPNSTETEVAVDVVVWVTDGENNRYQFDIGTGQKITIPQVELIDVDNSGGPSSGDRWQCATSVCTPTEIELIKKNRYAFGGQYVAPGKPGYDQAKTAQQWSDFMTLQRCTELRNRIDYEGKARPVIIYTVAVGDVGNLSTPVGKHTAEVMNECSYGIAGMQTDSPPAGMPKRFFTVQDSDDLNNAFRHIANALGRIRIID